MLTQHTFLTGLTTTLDCNDFDGALALENLLAESESEVKDLFIKLLNEMEESYRENITVIVIGIRLVILL